MLSVLFAALSLRVSSLPGVAIAPDGSGKGTSEAGASPIVPILAPIGEAQIVWNKTRDACPQTKKNPVKPNETVLCEEPDSVPIAWHNPLLNLSFLISATDCTFPGVGSTLDDVRGKHTCGVSPYVANRAAAPWTFDNHQWLQSARVFPNGSGFALVHNEFHGEQPPHNASWCSFERKSSTGQCVLWSTDSAATVDGGATWRLKDAPVLALPRKYLKDAAIAGYGELGQLQYLNGYYYAHVQRHFNAGTGGGPPGVSDSGTCAIRSQNLDDPRSWRGWNGSHWSTEWVNPYNVDTAASELWQRTCADISLAGISSSHVSVKKFAGPLTKISGWPTHAMSGLVGGRGGAAYYFPAANASADSDAAFTAWESSTDAARRVVDVQAWMDPCSIGGGMYDLMYPALIDHDSPFRLADDAAAAAGGGGGGDEARSNGLSYGLLGNTSLHLYFVLAREFIVRVPVAWFMPGTTLPRGPFPPPPLGPPPLNSVSCKRLAVKGADAVQPGIDGTYDIEAAVESDGTHQYRMDAHHYVYHFQEVWILGQPGSGGGRYVSAPKDVKGQGKGVPMSWGPCNNINVTCMD
jgi:hypothetical protein